jgi:histidine phosphotransfer protein HptB
MIDWDRVDALRDEIGDDDLAEVVALFLEETDAVAERLSGSSPAARLEADLHFMKGSALNLGFADLARACADGERQARSGTPPVDALPAILALYGASKSAFLEKVAPA